MANAGEVVLPVVPDTSRFGKDLAKQVDREVDGQKSGFKGAFGKIGAFAVAGLAAAGVAAGAALAKGLTTAISNEQVNDKLAAQLNLSDVQSEKAGKIAGGLFAQAYGESLSEVSGAVGAVMSSFEGLDDAGVQRLSASALDMANIFGIDVQEAVAYAGAAVEQGLAKDGTEALDLFTAGLQEVPAAMRGDLMEAINEYGPQLKGLGLSGSQAFGVLAEAAKKGKFSLDKVPDSLKELQLRGTDMSKASVEAYSAAGLSAEEMAGKIAAGGPTATEATAEIARGLLGIQDPVERSNAAIALFGAPLEDLGVTEIPSFLESLATVGDGLGDVSGRAADAGQKVNDNLGTRLETLKRGALLGLTTFVDENLLPAFDRLVTFVEGTFAPAFDTVRAAVQSAVDWVRANLAPAFDQVTAVLAKAGGAGALLAPVLAALGGAVVVAAVAAITAGVVALAGAVGAVLSPVVLVGGAIAAMVAGFVWAYQNIEPFRAAVDGVVATVRDGLLAALDAVRDWWAANGATVLDYARGVFEALGNIVAAGAAVIRAVFAAAVAAMTWAWTTFGSHLVAFLTATWENVQAILAGAFNVIRGILDVFIGVFTGNWSRALEGLQRIWSGLWSAVQAIFSQAWSILTTALNVASAALSSAWRGLWTAVEVFFAARWDAIVGWFKTRWAQLRAVYDTAMALYRAAWELAWDQVRDYFAARWEDIKGWFKTKWGELRGNYDAAMAAYRAVWEGAWSAVRDLFAARWAEIVGWFNTRWSELRASYDAVMAAYRAAWETAWTSVRDLFAGIWDSIRDAFSTRWAQLRATYDQVMADYQAAWSTAWTLATSVFTGTWDRIRGAFDTAWAALSGAIGAGVDAVHTRWSQGLLAVHDAFHGVWTAIVNVFSGPGGFRSRIEGAVRALVDAIGPIWDGIRRTLAAPIRWVQDKVLNGFIGAVNSVSKALGGGEDVLTPVTLVPEFHTGGVVGEGRAAMRNLAVNPLRRNEQMAVLEKGEEVVTAEQRRDRFAALQSGRLIEGADHNGGGFSTSGFGGVKPWVAQTGHFVRQMFGIRDIGGVGSRKNASDHPSGHALDFMVYKDRDTGEKLANYMVANAAHHAVKYVIWWQRINRGAGWRQMADRGSDTANHKDHPHVSFLRSAAGGSDFSGGGDTGGGGFFDFVGDAISKFVDPVKGLLDQIPGSDALRPMLKAAGQKLIDTGIQWIRDKFALFGGGAGGSGDVARDILGVANRIGMDAFGKLSMMETAIVESGSVPPGNPNHGDRDSLGTFQQRAAWGPASDRMNPVRSAEMFFNGGQGGQRGLLAFHDPPGKVWSGTAGSLAQKVQVSAHPGRYDARESDARGVLRSLGESFDRGGLLSPGMTLAFNGTGRDELVTAVDVLDDALDRAATRTGGGPIMNIENFTAHERADLDALVARLDFRLAGASL